MDELQTILAGKKRNEKPFAASIIVTSDTCSNDESKDESGAYVQKQLAFNKDLFSQVTKRCVKDDKQAIVKCLEKCFLEDDPALIITIGGTGLCPRDVTPDAISPFYDRHCTGIVAALNMTNLRYSPHAALSRLTAGIIGDCLVINFPGSLKACRDCLSCIDMFAEHALEQVRYNAKAYKDTHLKLQNNSVATKPAQAKRNSRENVLQQTPVTDSGQKPDTTEGLPKRSHTHVKRYYTRSSVSPDRQGAQPSSSHKFVNRLSRLSIKEVQESRLEQQLVNAGNVQSPRPSSNRKPFVFKKKFSSVDNLSVKQHQSASSNLSAARVRPLQISSTKVPRTQSEYPLIEYSDAHEILGSHSGDLLEGREEVVLNTFEAGFKLIGRVLTGDVTSKKIVPPYDVSTMDGYVLNIPKAMRKSAASIAKTVAPVVKDLSEFKELQRHPQRSQSFFCYPVNTGGRLPEKNYAVVPVEKTHPTADEGQVTILSAKMGVHVRAAGSDIDQRDVLSRGSVIGPVELSLLIKMGHKKVEVFKQPRIGVLSTGDEVVNFFATPELEQDQVADLNGPLLTSIFRLRGYFSYNHGIVKDEPEKILLAITEALKKCEVLIVTGGASMGTKDHVKDVIKHMGGTIHFGRVNIKPGKPAAFASIPVDGRRKFIFSLPGNPVSAYITAMLLVLPFVEHGTKNHSQREGTLSLDCIGSFTNVVVDEIQGEPYEFEDRLEFVRAKIISPAQEAPYKVQVSTQQQSSRLLSLKDFNCLIMVPSLFRGQRFVPGIKYAALKINNPL